MKKAFQILACGLLLSNSVIRDLSGNTGNKVILNMLPTKTYQMTLGELTVYVIGDESGWSMLAYEGRDKIKDVPLGPDEAQAKATALEFAASRVGYKYPEVEKTWNVVEGVPD